MRTKWQFGIGSGNTLTWSLKGNRCHGDGQQTLGKSDRTSSRKIYSGCCHRFIIIKMEGMGFGI